MGDFDLCRVDASSPHESHSGKSLCARAKGFEVPEFDTHRSNRGQQSKCGTHDDHALAHEKQFGFILAESDTEIGAEVRLSDL